MPNTAHVPDESMNPGIDHAATQHRPFRAEPQQTETALEIALAFDADAARLALAPTPRTVTYCTSSMGRRSSPSTNRSSRSHAVPLPLGRGYVSSLRYSDM